jgi:TPR repeat protein
MMKLLTEKTEQEFVEATVRLKKLFEDGDARAGYALTVYLDPDNEAIPPGWRQRSGASASECRRVCVETFRLLQEAANKGDGESMHLVAQFYQTGMPPVPRDMESFRDWCERAVAAGYTFAANDLYSLYSDPQSKFFAPDKARRFMDVINRADTRVVH